MTQLTGDQVRHIAKLARLQLTDAEVEKFAKELTSILQYVDMLQEVDTKNVQPTAQVTGQSNVFREDVIRRDGTSADSLLSCSPLPLADHQIVSPSAHG
ncbi:MAG: Asp-tRNA(Asn)/Glu-tRNA(Gln) amidotransferase subunit GatC [Candidatus Peribacteraceae bacterium]|nr:Asp-tRNA(Asn)/Glu-tRNA(Gln) amidotransferase subunit GatC [Candidatus Peribacteraceae bacterium]